MLVHTALFQLPKAELGGGAQLLGFRVGDGGGRTGILQRRAHTAEDTGPPTAREGSQADRRRSIALAERLDVSFTVHNHARFPLCI